MKDYWKDFTVIEKGQESLGGNLRHGDADAITPDLWRHLVDRFAIRSMLDVGAGEGHALHAFHRMGVIAHGFDGLDRNVCNAKFPMALHDLTKGPYIFPCDMTHCVEVAEHIEEIYVDNLLATLTNAPVIVMTHGLPGQLGHHHVNNQSQAYWVDKLGQRGYRLCKDNDRFRDLARQENERSYFSVTGLVFLKTVTLPPE
jgi:hypothetical protein